MSGKIWYQRKNYNQLTIPLVSAVAVILLTVLLLVPQSKLLFEDIKGFNKRREDLSLISEKATMLANFNEAELLVRSNSLMRILPSSEDLGYFVAAVRDVAKRAGVFIEGIDFIENSDEVERTTTEVSVRMNGTLETVRAFVLEVERSAPLAEIKSLTGIQQLDQEVFQATAVLKFYYEPLPDELGETIKPLQVISAANERTYQRLLDLILPEAVVLPRVPTGNVDLML